MAALWSEWPASLASHARSQPLFSFASLARSQPLLSLASLARSQPLFSLASLALSQGLCSIQCRSSLTSVSVSSISAVSAGTVRDEARIWYRPPASCSLMTNT